MTRADPSSISVDTQPPPENPDGLRGRTLLVSGGSRGIGLAIARTAARAGANVALIAKTAQPHPKLSGTVHTAVTEIQDAGGQALAIVGDVRRDEDIQRAIEMTRSEFGGIDILINNASAIDTAATASLTMKAYDLMMSINVRGSFALSKAALDDLSKSPDGRILSMSPPLNFSRSWLAPHPAYTVSKYAMTLAALAVAEEHRGSLAGFCLWPKTLIATDAVRNVLAGSGLFERARTPHVVADAAYVLLTQPKSTVAGRCFVDEDVLRSVGVEDFRQYQQNASDEPPLDLFISENDPVVVSQASA